jgi:GAF domain-containing protein
MSGFESLLQRYLSIPSNSESENMLRLLIRMGLMVTGADEGSLLVLDDAESTLLFAMTIGNEDSAAALRGQRVPLGQGITGLAAATLEVQIGAPLYKDVQQSVRMDGAADGPTAVMAAPMLIGERLVGVITAVSFVAHKHFTTEDGKLFGGFAAIAGVLVDQGRRLTRLSTTTSIGVDSADQARIRIAASIARMAQVRPVALEEIAVQIESVERLVTGGT